MAVRSRVGLCDSLGLEKDRLRGSLVFRGHPKKLEDREASWAFGLQEKEVV